MKLIFFILLAIVPLLAEGVKIVDMLTKKPISDAKLICGSVIHKADSNGTVFLDSLDSDCLQVVKAPGYKIYQSKENRASIQLMPFDVKGVFVSFYGISSESIMEGIYDLADKKEINTVVIEIKSDTGHIAFKNSIPLAQEIGANSITTIKDIHALIAHLKEKGIYTVAKIAVFKDNLLATKRQQFAIRDRKGNLFYDRQDMAWSDPFVKEVQNYNIQVALMAADAGFDEVMFDYVRFPDHNHLKYAQENNETARISTIETFLARTKEAFENRSTFTSAAIFGYTAWNKNDTGIGQDIETIGSCVDYLAPMLYPSGFSFGIPNYRKPLDHPYEIVYQSIEKSKERSGLNAKKFRPWIQAFKDYAFDKRSFGLYEVDRQIEGAIDSGCSGVYIWNPKNRYSLLDRGSDKVALSDVE